MGTPTDCAVHPGTPVWRACASCDKPGCERCLPWEVDGRPTCDACGAAADERSRALGSTLIVLVGVAYLAALAVTWTVFRARPFIGGASAIVAIVVGRALQLYFGPATIARRGDAR